MSNKAISVYAEALQRNQEEKQQVLETVAPKIAPKSAPRSALKPERKPAHKRGRTLDTSRHTSRDRSLNTLREGSRDRAHNRPLDLPSREEIQEFSFRLRDEVNVKVQPRVPHPWQKQLEKIARELDVKKLELYRFIIGEFLGKVKRKKPA